MPGHMFTGDSLAVILFLASGIIGCLIGALSTEAPSRSKAITGLGVVFLVILIGWIATPSALPYVDAVRSVIEALVDSGAPVLVGTVTIVALMRPPREGHAVVDEGPSPESTTAEESEPAFAEYENELSKWRPDMPFVDAFIHIGEESTWAKSQHNLTLRDVEFEVQAALTSGKLTAWGKAHPDEGRHWQIRKFCWDELELNARSNLAFFPRQNVTSYDLKMSKGQLLAAYPKVEAQD